MSTKDLQYIARVTLESDIYIVYDQIFCDSSKVSDRHLSGAATA